MIKAQKPPKAIKNTSEASYRHLPVIFTHTQLQKVRGFVGELFVNEG
jgi:hypothetical protein